MAKRPFKVYGPLGEPIRTFGVLTHALGSALQTTIEGPIGTHVVLRAHGNAYIVLDRCPGRRVRIQLQLGDTEYG